MTDIFTDKRYGITLFELRKLTSCFDMFRYEKVSRYIKKYNITFQRGTTLTGCLEIVYKDLYKRILKARKIDAILE